LEKWFDGDYFIYLTLITMKKALILLLFLIIVTKLQGQQEKRLIILHTNDLHSRLTGYAPESEYTPLTRNDDNTIGGFARIAGIIKAEKQNNKGATLVLDAGDFMMGTLFPSLELETGFQLRLMKKMGYDAAGLGNHEFDFGPGWLAGVIGASAAKGDIPSLLSSNTLFSEKDSADNTLEELFSKKIVSRKLVIERNGIKIGLFSILGKDADSFAPNASPVTFAKQSATAKKMVRELRDEKCGIIICVSHSGLVREKTGEWGGEDVDLARKVKGISLIIGGHSHTRLDKPLVVNGIPIVQAGEFGKFVGRLSLLYTNGKMIIEDYKLIPVDDKIESDGGINQLIEEQKEKISTNVLMPLGLSYRGAVAEAGFILEGNDMGDYVQSNLGPVVADAIHHYVNGKSGRGTDVSLIAAGMLFDKILPGVQTAPDIFRIMPLGAGKDNIPGYPLARIYITGKELKSVLEILQVAYKSSSENYCYYSGILVEYNPDKGFLKKIRKIDIIHPDGKVTNVDFDRKSKMLYSITADSYMLGFIGIIKKMSFGLINVVPKDYEGNKIKDKKVAVIDMDEKMEGVQEGKEWLALIGYFSSMKDVNGNGIPDIDIKYSVPVKCFFPVNTK
jgi:5'-nucleotidase / UDP-sugar diphosphatase